MATNHDALDTILSTTHAFLRAEIHHDPDCEQPELLTVITYNSRRYTLGTEPADNVPTEWHGADLQPALTKAKHMSGVLQRISSERTAKNMLAQLQALVALED